LGIRSRRAAVARRRGIRGGRWRPPL